MELLVVLFGIWIYERFAGKAESSFFGIFKEAMESRYEDDYAPGDIPGI